MLHSKILKGVQDANKKYEKWSKGHWLIDAGIEGHLVSTIARKLSGHIGCGSLVMEVSFDGIFADIVLFDSKDRPICVIEVKRTWRPWNEDNCIEDLERIRDLVIRYGEKGDGSLKRGFFAVMLVASDETRKGARNALKAEGIRIKELISRQSDRFDQKELILRFHRSGMREYPAKYRKKYDEDYWVHAGFCIELSNR